MNENKTNINWLIFKKELIQMNENKTNINWLITINLNPFRNPYNKKKN